MLGSKKRETNLSSVIDFIYFSLPAVLLDPYSILETVAFRNLNAFEILFELNNQEDPFQKFLIVLKWLLCCLPQERFHKKVIHFDFLFNKILTTKIAL